MSRNYYVPRIKITRREFYASGGFSDPGLVRIMKGGTWTYWRYGRNWS